MVTRALCLAVAAMLCLQGCTSTIYYAVVAPRKNAGDEGGCFRQCQLIHAGETKQYLACLHNCPDIRVVNDKQCRDVALDASQYDCSTAHAQKFDPTLGIVAIAMGVLVVIVMAATASSSESHTQ